MSLAAIIGTVSVFVSIVTAYRLLFEYVISPVVKDGYLYPQWRYRLFDVVLVLWCFDGMLAAAFLIRSLTREDAGGWARRTTVLFFVGLGMLVAGVAVGTWIRRHGV